MATANFQVFIIFLYHNIYRTIDLLSRCYCMSYIYFDIFTSLTNIEENYFPVSCFETISGKFKKRVDL